MPAPRAPRQFLKGALRVRVAHAARRPGFARRRGPKFDVLRPESQQDVFAFEIRREHRAAHRRRRVLVPARLPQPQARARPAGKRRVHEGSRVPVPQRHGVPVVAAHGDEPGTVGVETDANHRARTLSVLQYRERRLGDVRVHAPDDSPGLRAHLPTRAPPTALVYRQTSNVVDVTAEMPLAPRVLPTLQRHRVELYAGHVLHLTPRRERIPRRVLRRALREDRAGIAQRTRHAHARGVIHALLVLLVHLPGLGIRAWWDTEDGNRRGLVHEPGPAAVHVVQLERRVREYAAAGEMRLVESIRREHRRSAVRVDEGVALAYGWVVFGERASARAEPLGWCDGLDVPAGTPGRRRGCSGTVGLRFRAILRSIWPGRRR